MSGDYSRFVFLRQSCGGLIRTERHIIGFLAALLALFCAQVWSLPVDDAKLFELQVPKTKTVQSLMAETPYDWQAQSRWMYGIMLARWLDLEGDTAQALRLTLTVAEESRSSSVFAVGFETALTLDEREIAEAYARSWFALFPDDSAAQDARLIVCLQKSDLPCGRHFLQQRLRRKNGFVHVSEINHFLDYLPRQAERIYVLDDMRRLFPENAYVHYFYGQRLLENGELLAAIEVFQQALLLEPLWMKIYVVQANTLSAIGRLQEARALLRDAIQDYPNEAELFFAYTDLLIKNYAYDEARALIETRLQQQGEPRERLLRQLLWIALREGDAARVEQLYRLMVERHLMSEDAAQVAMARFWAGQKNYAQARQLFLGISETSSEYHEAQQQLASLLIKEGRVEEGRAAFVTLRQHASSSQALDHFFYESAVLEDQKLYDLQIDVLKVALRRFPSDRNLQYLFGVALMNRGNYQAAYDHFVRMLSSDAHAADVLNACGYIQMNYFGNDDAAQAYIEKALELYPESSSIQDSYGWLLYQRGKPEEALKWLLRAYSEYRQGEISVHLVEVLAITGHEDRAREIYALERKGQPQNEALYALGKKLAYEN